MKMPFVHAEKSGLCATEEKIDFPFAGLVTVSQGFSSEEKWGW